MGTSRLYADADALTLALDGQAPVKVSEMAFAVLNLRADGFEPDAIRKRLGPAADQGLYELEIVGVTSASLPEIEMSGHVFRADDTPPDGRHVVGQLSARAASDPDALAVLVEDPLDPEAPAIPVSAGELWEMTDTVASRLAGDGLRAGDHIAVSAEPSLDTTVLCLAAWEVGLSVVLLRRSLPPAFHNTVRSRIAPRLWFMHDASDASDDRGWIDLAAGDGETGLDAWIERGDMVNDRPVPDPDREAVVVTTSGSTGQPKMIALSQRNLYQTGRFALLAGPDTPATRHSAVTDLSALSGLRSLVVLPAMSHGAAVLLAPQSRDNSLLALASLGRHGVTVAQAIVGTLRAAAELGREKLGDLSLGALSVMCCGTGVLHKDIRVRAEDALNVEIRDHYGMNETTGAFAWSSDGTVGDVGANSHDLMLRIVDQDGNAVAKGDIGHLRFCGERLFIGQYTASGFEPRPPGWFTSGDMARRLPDGRFVVTGRSHDLLKTREGEFLSPLAVENAVLGHADISDAVVIRLPDKNGVESYALFVETSRPSDALDGDLRDLIRAELGVFAEPEMVMCLPDLPRAAHGKPDRAKLRQMLNDRLSGGYAT